MNLTRALAAVMLGVVAAVGVSAAAHADPDTDFAEELQTYGIYGPRDYNAWIGKITCDRMDRNIDRDAYASAQFVSNQLNRGSTTPQAWQFLGAAINAYCPEKYAVLQTATRR